MVSAMSSMWGTGTSAARVNPEALHERLGQLLAGLELLLPRLSVYDSEVTQRDLVQARSQTALSCRLHARLQRSEPESRRCRPADSFFGQAELLEHALSFLASAEHLARVGAVCSQWYIASRSGALWEGQLRASGRLDGPHPAMRELPHEDEWTLFETAARIERHGCRPIDNAASPTLGRIDAFVDDLAAYQLCTQVKDDANAAGAVLHLVSVPVRPGAE